MSYCFLPSHQGHTHILPLDIMFSTVAVLYFSKWSNKKQTEILTVLRGSKAPSGNIIQVSALCNLLQWLCDCVYLSAPCRKCGKACAFLQTLSCFSSNESPCGFHQMPPTANAMEKEGVWGKQSFPCSADLTMTLPSPSPCVYRQLTLPNS